MSQDQEQPADLIEAHALIMALQEEQLAPEQATRLEELVCEHVEVRKLYVKYLHQRSVIASIAQPAQASLDDSRTLDDTMVMRAIPSAANFAEEDAPLPPPPISGMTIAEVRAAEERAARGRRRLMRYALAAGVFIAFASLTFILLR